jgi:hypothetical protein
VPQAYHHRSGGCHTEARAPVLLIQGRSGIVGKKMKKREDGG